MLIRDLDSDVLQEMMCYRTNSFKAKKIFENYI